MGQLLSFRVSEFATSLTESQDFCRNLHHTGIVMAEINWQAEFEKVWEFREETLYSARFGPSRHGTYVLSGEIFTSVFRQDSYDPRWLTHGIIEFEPTDERTSWLYVSSGLSNPWEEDSFRPDDRSGIGCEFIFQSPTQSFWAISFLQRMLAFQLILAAGRFPGRGLLEVWHRVPLRGPIDGKSSLITWVLLTPAAEFGPIQQLSSGRFQFIEFVGITEDEAEFARQKSGEQLLALLRTHGAAPV